METKANYVAVGLFTLILTLAGFGIVYWTSGLGAGADIVTLRVRIPGSAAGLGRGSAVLFNGVKVGDVRRVYIDISSPNLAIAETEIDRLTPITASTRADIGLAGLTGQASIELKGGNPDEPNLIELADAEGRIAEITANPSAVTNLLQTAQDIFERTDRLLVTLEGFTSDVRGPLTDTVGNLQTFSAALGRNADGIDTFLGSVSELSQTLGAVSGRLDSTLTAAEELIRAVDRDKVANVVANVETFTTRLDTATANLEGVMKNVDETVVSVRRLADGANQSLAKVDGFVDDLKAGFDTTVASIGKVADNASGTLARVDGLVDELKTGVGTTVERVARVADDASGTLASARELIDSVDVGQVRRIVASVDAFTARLDTATANLEGVMKNVDETVVSVRKLADGAGVTLGRVAGFVDDLKAGVDTTVASIGKVANDATGTLSRVDGLVDELKTGVGTTVERVGKVADEATGTLTSARELIDTVDREQVRKIIASVETFTTRLDAATANLEGVMKNVDETVVSVRKLADGAGDTLARVDGFVVDLRAGVDTTVSNVGKVTDGATATLGRVDRILEGVDPDAVRSAVANIDGATRDARAAAADVAALAERFAQRTDDIDQIITDARQIASKLNQASTRVDGVLAKVDGMLGSGEGDGVVVEARETLKAFRQVADTLNARLGTITDGLARFSGQGLRDVEALVRDSRRSINRIEQAITSIERNPQRLLSGGEGTVRQYDGRVRR